jgi:hypothetical protein
MLLQLYETPNNKTPVDNQLTDNGQVVTITRRQRFTPIKIPGIHFYYRLSQPQGLLRPERYGKTAHY